MRDTPRQRNLSTVLAVLVANLDEGLVLDHFADVFARVVDFVGVAKGRVLGDVDVVCLVEVGEGVLG